MDPSETGGRMLLLLRHGKAEPAAEQDHQRDLAAKGRDQARLVGDYLAAQGVRPDLVLVSDAERTRQTWENVQAAMPDHGGEVDIREEIYHGGPAQVVELLREVPAEKRVVLVVGHEPTMSVLGHLLASDDESDPGAIAQARLGLPTGAMCVLTGDLGSWSDLDEDTLELHTIVRS
ncbi:MAG: phosphohistidine phosphatase SixA [Brachybacterium sp.]|nr:phosphohistidine phosphatase SixA [Brachybacterium sp.]